MKKEYNTCQGQDNFNIQIIDNVTIRGNMMEHWKQKPQYHKLSSQNVDNLARTYFQVKYRYKSLQCFLHFLIPSLSILINSKSKLIHTLFTIS